MLGFNGGRLGALNAPSLTSARGMWTPNEQYIARTAGNWPLGTDPYWSNVSLLLHFDAPNGSTVFTDSSSQALAATRVGDAVISTAQSKFGGSSLALDGTGDALQYSSTSPGLSFGTGAFTVESWVYFNNIATTMTLVSAYNTGTGTMTIQHAAGSGWLIKNNAGSTQLTTSVQSTANTWQHIAFSRTGGFIQAFLDGIQIGPTLANTTSYSLTPGNMNIGRRSAADYMNGYFDDFRITAGVGRYTTNFTPPTARFFDS